MLVISAWERSSAVQLEIPIQFCIKNLGMLYRSWDYIEQSFNGNIGMTVLEMRLASLEEILDASYQFKVKYDRRCLTLEDINAKKVNPPANMV